MYSLDNSAAIFSYHRDMTALHGANSSLALGWLTGRDQIVRFKALTDIADLNDMTVLDAGCGYADLYNFISQNAQTAHYYGVEQIPELLQQARQQLGKAQNVTLIEGNFFSTKLPEADYVFASGSLNYGSSNASYIFDAITTLFECCTRGMAFNLLKHVPRNGLIVAYPPRLILDHCCLLSNNVVFKDGYADDDFTVWMYR